jgi:hypothetical protein
MRVGIRIVGIYRSRQAAQGDQGMKYRLLPRGF